VRKLQPEATLHARRSAHYHRLIDQTALDRMEARIYADPSLMKIRRCTVSWQAKRRRLSGG